MSDDKIRRSERRARLATFLFSLEILILSAVIAYSTFIARDHRLTICEEVEKVKAQIHMTVERSNKTLPTIVYFREHPAELKQALEQNQKTLKTFAPDSCG